MAYEAVDERSSILVLGTWDSEESLHDHLRSDHFWRLLHALDLSGRAPEVSFYQVTGYEGMQLIHRLRDEQAKRDLADAS